MRLSIAVLVVVVAAAGVADARTIHGQVFVDRDRDGHPSAGEPGVAGAVVAFDIATYVVTDAGGQFDLEIPGRTTGIAWVRVPDGFVPGPVFARVGPTTTDVDLALTEAAPRIGPLTFVVAADTHVSFDQTFALDLREVATAATAGDPAFFAILGDVTQGSKERDYRLVDASLAGLGVPYVPVPGNHDWYDGGVGWFAHYGPDNYSFDVAGVHFVVWNLAMTEDSIAYYLGLELARVDRAMPIVALTHAPPSPAVLARLRALGVNYVLTGHTHTNNVVDHDGLIELNTEPMLMGGLDDTPAGYRVITFAGKAMTSEHRTVVTAPVASLIAPGTGCAHAGDPIVVAAMLDASATTVRATIDCATPIELAYAGGWSYRAPLPPLADGVHAIAIAVRGASGAHAETTAGFTTCASPLEHRAALVPPLAARWTQTVGGHVLQAAPVVGGDTVYVAVTDLADGATGGIVALDLATGEIRWRHATAMPVRGAPALVGTAVIVSTIDGTVTALDAATGERRWHTPLGEDVRAEAAALLGAPTVDAGEILVANQHRVAALDPATGAARWTADPMTAPFDFVATSAVAAGDGFAIVAPGRELAGVVAFDRATGAVAWRYIGHPTAAVNGSPLVAGDTVYLVDGADQVHALDVATGEPRWRKKLDRTGFEWGAAIAATPAIARGILVVPTLYGDVVALDTAAGTERWRHAASAPSSLRTTHYRGAGMAGFEASAVIAGDVVWTIDTAGMLTALELDTGRAIWETPLGAPGLAAPAIAGDSLVIASYDGTVRRFAPTTIVHNAMPASCARPPVGGCCQTGRADPALLLGLLAFRRRAKLRA